MMRLFLFVWAFAPIFLFGQNLNPVSWSFDIEKINDSEYNLIYTADIEKGWNVYSQFIDEGGPFPTTITYESENVELIGKGEEEGYRKEGMDPIFEMKVIKFLAAEPYVIKQRIRKGSEEAIAGYLTFMTCDDEKCLPPMDVDFVFNLKDSYQGGNEDRASVDNVNNEASKTSLASDNSAAAPSATDNSTTKVTTNPVEKPKSLQWIVAPKGEMPVQWSYAIENLSDTRKNLWFKADIDRGWNVYSQFIDEGGPFPTTLYYEQEEGIKLEGKAKESGAKKEGMDPIFDMHVIKYLDKEAYLISQSIEVTDADQPVSGVLTYMTCDDEKCLPPTDIEFYFDVQKGIALATASGHPDESLAAAARSGNVIDQVRPRLKETFIEPLADCGEESSSNKSMLLMFIFGFAGGLLALLTPCVFPMIPLTVSFFTKDTKRKGWWNGTVYGLSIIVIYVTIGLLITALFGEEALNSLSTNWIANTMFFLIFVFFAFSFFGFYEITLPSSWTNSSDKMADKGGLIGIFFMAFTLALVSFSCTGPLIGTALVQAASNQVGPFTVMFGFSLALALPFGLFAAFPAWLNSLPKSGGWMNSVKVVLGFLELALAFKFLTVADLTSHWGLLKYEVFLGIWIIIALAMAAYGMGWIKFPHDSPVNRISTRRWAFSIGMVLFAGYLTLGFRYDDTIKSYQSLSLLSGLAPPVSYNMFLDEPEVDKELKARYPSFGKCANNIDCFKDYFEGLAYAKEVDKPILIDHTGHGCVNCRRTEDNIWSDDRIRKMLNDDFVLVSLYVDDREPLEEILVSESRNEKLRTVGRKWADFQIVNFAQISQPLYVIVTPDEEVVTNPRGYKEGIEGYFDYLECGLNTFKSVSMK